MLNLGTYRYEIIEFDINGKELARTPKISFNISFYYSSRCEFGWFKDKRVESYLKLKGLYNEDKNTKNGKFHSRNFT